MTVKTLSTVAVRVIGWLVILEGIKSALSSVLLLMMRAMATAASDSPRVAATWSYLPVATAVIAGLIEVGIGFSLIGNSEFFGRIFCKGIEERT